VAIPVLAPLALVRDEVPTTGSMRSLGKLTASFCVSGAVVFFFLIATRLVAPAAGLATALFAFGTTLMPVAAQALWMHGPATFWLCAALWLSLPRHSAVGRPACRDVGAGLALGLAIFTRPTTVLFMLAAAGGLVLQQRWRRLALLLAGAAPLVLALLGYNHWITGSTLSGGYGQEASEWNTSLGLGLAGLLIAPSRGLLVYSPALLLAGLGLYALLRHPRLLAHEERALVLAWSAGAFATLLLYAKWHAWAGGSSYGPRFLIETLPVFCLLFGFGVASLRTRLAHRGATLLVGISIVIQLLGIFGTTADWDARGAGDERASRYFALSDTQIEAHARTAVRRVVGAIAPMEGSNP
jgi:hypothetical protein